MIYAVAGLAIAVLCLIVGFLWGRSNVRAQIEQAVEKEHVALDAREFAMRTQLEDAIAEIAKLRPLADELGRVQKRLEREQAKYAQMKADFNATMGITAVPSVEGNSEPETQSARTHESADEAIQKLLQSLQVFNDPNVPGDGDPALRENPEPAPPAIVPTAAVPPTPRIAQPPRNAEVPKAGEAARSSAPARPAVPPQPKEPVPATTRLSGTVAPATGVPPRPPAPQPQKVAPPEPRKPLPSAPMQPAAAAVPTRPAPAEPARPGQTVDEWQEFARQLEALTGKKK